MPNSGLNTYLNTSFTFHARPRQWLAALQEATGRAEAEELWHWTAVHHQILTLVERCEQLPTSSALWFSIADTVFGVGLPDGRVALALPPQSAPLGRQDLEPALLRLRPKLVLASRETLLALQAADCLTVLATSESQTAWRKQLLAAETDSPRASVRVRRPTARERQKTTAWARAFALEQSQSLVATTLEAETLRRRAELFVLDHSPKGCAPTAVGMVALSGELRDKHFGHSLRLSLLYIEPQFRGGGLGSAAVRALEARALHDHLELHSERLAAAAPPVAMVLFANELEPRARAFYSNLGYSLCGDWLEVSVKTTG